MSVIHETFANTDGFDRFYQEGSTEANARYEIAAGALQFNDADGVGGRVTRGEYGTDSSSGYVATTFFAKGIKSGADLNAETVADVFIRGSVAEDGDDRDSSGYLIRFARDRVVVCTCVAGVITIRDSEISGEFDVLTEDYAMFEVHVFQSGSDTIIQGRKEGGAWASWTDTGAPQFAENIRGVLIGASVGQDEHICFDEMTIGGWDPTEADDFFVRDTLGYGIGVD